MMVPALVGMLNMIRLVRSPQMPNAGQFETSELRYSVVLAAMLHAEGDDEAEPLLVRINNISCGGCMATLPRALKLTGATRLTIRHIGTLAGRIAWSRGARVGIAFDEQIDPLEMLATRAERAARPAQIAQAAVDRARSSFGHRSAAEAAVQISQA